MYAYSWIEDNKVYEIVGIKSIDEAFRMAIWDNQEKAYRHDQHIRDDFRIYDKKMIDLYKRVNRIDYTARKPRLYGSRY